MSQIEAVKEKLRVIRVLRLLKKNYTYEELSRITGLPITVLNRYVRGKVLPSTQRTRELIKVLSPYVNLEEEVKRRIIFDKHGLFDNLKILSDNDLMNLIAESIASKYRDKKIDKILTAATDGIPLAIHIGNELGVDVVYAKKKREVGVEKFYEVNYVSSSSGSVMTLYLPHWAIKKGENILIVDDVVRSGETQKALLEMCKQANTTPVGMFFLISVGSVIDRIKEEYKIPVDAMIHL
ncbi:MAG TPA: helix-turn-helix domain-containing protein [Thermococcus sp.]|nr:MAG: adenine phosphoribosyltransferase [Archaeoglobales archaeon ex4484_92]RLF75827.1 MAG: adenine phosphoribosyltransferase [Thermococci archaeon]RLF84256.1 MAG: adenine phosphoribosyltransferase [Thermococci archaeon]RLF84678.1 MAG: adenine phosphoribosyltransferase [Thermococci archaeon]HDH45207.1 helix-turn-helix domain-containing protein [Thermococcus sp.]